MKKLQMEGNKSPYTLSEADNTRIFEQRIVPELLADVPSQTDPVFAMLIAQHGAGKSSLAENVIVPTLEERGGLVDIDSDIYKTYHPAYEELMELDDQAMAIHTAADGQRWMRQALHFARERRQNTLVQETVQNPPFLVDMIGTYRSKGFEIDIKAMGVAEAVSRQGILHRYHTQRTTMGAGRLPAPEKVQASLRGILDFADTVDTLKIADSTAVFRRGNLRPSYVNGLDGEGEWFAQPGFRKAIERERARPLNSQEAQHFQLTHNHLTRALGKDLAPELEQVSHLGRQLIREWTKDPDDELTS